LVSSLEKRLLAHDEIALLPMPLTIIRSWKRIAESRRQPIGCRKSHCYGRRGGASVSSFEALPRPAAISLYAR